MRIREVIANRFELELLAGKGGMGEVYRALDRHRGERVALKILHGQRDDDLGRFEREARILSELEDPLIVRHIAHGTLPSGDPYLVMEWLEGEDLAARLARGRLSVAESVDLAISLADALSLLHERRIVHRDIKPSNVFLVDGRIQQAKLLDLGLAWRENSARITASGMLLGTVAYMAPEQARGARELDARVDVFALGCVLFECLTGKPAFSGAHVGAVLTKILFEETPSLYARLERIRAPEMALEDLLGRLLAKRADERPRNGREVADALRALRDTTTLFIQGSEPTVAMVQAPSLTNSEKRVMAVILLSADADEGLEVPDDARLAEEAAAHGGTFERLLDGTAAILLSGTEVATDLAARAARCALALRRSVPRGGIALAIGRSEARARRLVGPVIDRAAQVLELELELEPRLGPETATPRGNILLDDDAVGLLDLRFDVRKESGVFFLYGEYDATETRTLLGRPTPCVGRERELRQLEAIFEDCRTEDEPQVVLVTGPPGAGKSRIGRELVVRIRSRFEPVKIWIARGEPLRKGSALGMLAELCRSACGIRGGESVELRQLKLQARVAERVGKAEGSRLVSFLGELIGAPSADEESLPLRAARKDAELMSEHIRSAFLDFLSAECELAPVVILLEDLHWGDGATVRILDQALRDFKDKPLFVLALARPEVHELFPRLWAGRAMQEIALRALSRKAAGRLAQHVLGEGAGPETIERIVQLSEGNAFYLEELIRRAAEGRGADLPETVVAMVQSRLGALDDESRRILRAASVFGETFWGRGVTALLGDASARTGSVTDRLEELVQKEILVAEKESRFPEQRQYAFCHALMREGAYGLLTDADLALGHRLAGHWLAACGERDPLVLAEHFEKGGEYERAARELLRAVNLANAAGDSRAAVSYVSRALEHDLPEELRIAVHGSLCEAIVWQRESVAFAIPAATELVQATPGGSLRWVQGMLVLLIQALQEGSFERFLGLLEELRTIEPADEAVATLGIALFAGIYVLDFHGRLPEADAVSERLALFDRVHGETEPMATVLWHAMSATRMAYAQEDPWSAYQHGEAARSTIQSIKHPRYLGMAERLIGLNRWFLGACAEAEQGLRNATAPEEAMGLGSSLRPFALAWLLADRGELDEAQQWASRLVEAGRARRLPADEGRGHWALAEVLRRKGELEAAEVEIQAARAFFGWGWILDMPGVLATHAALLLAKGSKAEALATAEEGLAHDARLGACSHFFRGAYLRLIHAECLEARGDHEAARAAIERARERLFALADKIGDPDYRKSFLEKVPENRRTLELACQWLGA